MLLLNLIQVTESISGSVVPLAMFFLKVTFVRHFPRPAETGPYNGLLGAPWRVPKVQKWVSDACPVKIGQLDPYLVFWTKTLRHQQYIYDMWGQTTSRTHGMIYITYNIRYLWHGGTSSKSDRSDQADFCNIVHNVWLYVFYKQCVQSQSYAQDLQDSARALKPTMQYHAIP